MDSRNVVAAMGPSPEEAGPALEFEPVSADEVHVWRFAPASVGGVGFDPWLSESEKSRAQRYKFAVHEQRFRTGRGLLRLLLGRYAAIAPERITLNFGAYGKPSLAGVERLHFNVSHTSGLSTIAISGRAVGVDVERPDRRLDLRGIAESNFCRAERDLLTSDPGRFEANFYRIWTRKEACLKLTGTGLSTPLTEIDTTMEMLTVRDGPGGRACTVRLRTYVDSDGCPLSVATGDGVPNVRFFTITPNVLERLREC